MLRKKLVMDICSWLQRNQCRTFISAWLIGGATQTFCIKMTASQIKRAKPEWYLDRV